MEFKILLIDFFAGFVFFIVIDLCMIPVMIMVEETKDKFVKNYNLKKRILGISKDLLIMNTGICIGIFMLLMGLKGLGYLMDINHLISQ